MALPLEVGDIAYAHHNVVVVRTDDAEDRHRDDPQKVYARECSICGDARRFGSIDAAREDAERHRTSGCRTVNGRMTIRYNIGPGTNWTADDDAGFHGGSDDLAELIKWIREWSSDEGINEADMDIRVILAG